jgi:hypothetical protein
VYYSSDTYDRPAALAGRVHRRRPERRAYPRPPSYGWSTAAYVREYFTLNTEQPSLRKVFAYPAHIDHTTLYLPLGTALQEAPADVIEERVE